MTRRPLEDLPLCAVYSLAQLASAARIERRRLRRILEEAGVSFLRSGRYWLVSVSELEKVPPLWEGIKATYALRGGEDP